MKVQITNKMMISNRILSCFSGKECGLKYLFLLHTKEILTHYIQDRLIDCRKIIYVNSENCIRQRSTLGEEILSFLRRVKARHIKILYPNDLQNNNVLFLRCFKLSMLVQCLNVWLVFMTVN